MSDRRIRKTRTNDGGCLTYSLMTVLVACMPRLVRRHYHTRHINNEWARCPACHSWLRLVAMGTTFPQHDNVHGLGQCPRSRRQA